MKQDESHGCSNTNNYKEARPMAFWLGKVDAVRRGAKTDKISNNNHHKKHQHIQTIHISKQEGHDGSGSLT